MNFLIFRGAPAFSQEVTRLSGQRGIPGDSTVRMWVDRDGVAFRMLGCSEHAKRRQGTGRSRIRLTPSDNLCISMPPPLPNRSRGRWGPSAKMVPLPSPAYQLLKVIHSV